jgi:hypothetical protein
MLVCGRSPRWAPSKGAVSEKIDNRRREGLALGGARREKKNMTAVV